MKLLQHQIKKSLLNIFFVISLSSLGLESYALATPSAQGPVSMTAATPSKKSNSKKLSHAKKHHPRHHHHLTKKAVKKPAVPASTGFKAPKKIQPISTKKTTIAPIKSLNAKPIPPHHTTAIGYAPVMHAETFAAGSQDYVLMNDNTAIKNSLTATKFGIDQDLANGGFEQQIKARLANDRALVCAIAEAQIGKPYEWGGESPHNGFDCSGLSQFVYAEEGIEIPRTALDQYHSLMPVKNLRVGDLVFFKTYPDNQEVSHVGIYIGEGYFIHAPRTGERIRIDRLGDPYWSAHYVGARRVLISNNNRAT